MTSGVASGSPLADVVGLDVDELLSALSSLPLDPKKPSASHLPHGEGQRLQLRRGRHAPWHHKNRVTAEELQALLDELVDELMRQA